MKKGYLYVALATILFSTMEISLKLFSGGFNAMQINLIRFLIGSVLLLPATIKVVKNRGIKLRASDFGFFALTGFICVVVSMTLFQMAVMKSKASIVAVLFSCNPVFVIPFAFILLKEKIYKSTILSMFLSVVGMLFIMNPMKMARGSTVGIVLSLLSAASFALYGVVGKFKSDRYGGVVLSAFSFLFGSAELLALMLVSKVPAVAGALTGAGLKEFANMPVLQGITLQSIPGLLYLGIFVTGLGYTFYFLAMEETSASTASLVFYIKPALAPVLAFLILHEALTANMLAGIALIVFGSAVTFIPAIVNRGGDLDEEKIEIDDNSLE